jgi:peptidoglycan biosynthesis protein MviN/MurJ (putative lipid II flippase)
LVILNISDLILTYYALKRRKAQDINPIARFLYKKTNWVGLASWKVLGLLIVFYLLYLILKIDIYIAYLLLVIFILIFSIIILWNIVILVTKERKVRNKERNKNE